MPSYLTNVWPKVGHHSILIKSSQTFIVLLHIQVVFQRQHVLSIVMIRLILPLSCQSIAIACYFLISPSLFEAWRHRLEWALAVTFNEITIHNVCMISSHLSWWSTIHQSHAISIRMILICTEVSFLWQCFSVVFSNGSLDCRLFNRHWSYVNM